MARGAYYDVFTDRAGNVLAGASVVLSGAAGGTVYSAGSGGTAFAGGTVIAGADGSVNVYPDADRYTVTTTLAGYGSLVKTIDIPTPTPRAQALLAARGIMAETLPKNACTASVAPTAGRIYAALTYLFAGEVVSGLVACTITAGAGTVPTLIKLGLQNSAGAVVVMTGNVASGTWSTGEHTYSLTAPYTVPTSGFYNILFLQSGSWGTTQHTMLNGSGSGFSGSYAPLAGRPYTFDIGATGSEPYADLPAVAATLTMTGGGTNTRAYWFGVA